jgi:hypothetical protein
MAGWFLEVVYGGTVGSVDLRSLEVVYMFVGVCYTEVGMFRCSLWCKIDVMRF